MEIRFTDDPDIFAALAEEFMRTDPFSTNVIGTHTAGILDGTRTRGAEDMWAVVSSGSEVVGVAMHTPPYHLFLPRMKADIASQLAGAVIEHGRPVAGVNGEVGAVAAFTGTWTALTGTDVATDANMWMYRLGGLRHPSGVPGSARMAGRGDLATLKDWFNAFRAEALPHHPDEEVGHLVENRLAADELTVWVDGETPVSLAACSAPAAGVARIGPVYTPAAQRRRGYGAAVTAWATARAVERGAAHVALYTDASNPTSNSIYRSIGYVFDHEATERRFVDKPGPARR